MRLPTRAAYRHFPLALVLATSLYSLGFWLFGPLGELPWAEASAKIRADFQPHDAWAVRPWWAQRAREYLGDLATVQVRDLAAEDLSRYGRLWLISLPGAESPGGPFADGTYNPAGGFEVGDLGVRLFELGPPARIVYDFRAELKNARVAIAAKGGRRACERWVDDRWVCSHHDWNYVGRMIVELGDDPRPVVWAHPTEEGPIEINYPRVPGGDELLVHTGLTPPAARTPDGAPVTLEVVVAGTVVESIVQPNRTGFFAHHIDISDKGPGPYPVTFRVSAPRAGMRHFCFAAEVRK